MRRTICASLFALATSLLGVEARAAGDFGLHTGDTLSAGDLMPYGEAGWPDISAGLQYGLSSTLDIGARLSLLYGWEGTTLTNAGMGLRLPVRVSLTKRSKFSALFHIDPGIKLYGYGHEGDFRYRGNFNGYCGSNPAVCYSAVFGLQFPLGAEFGIHLTPEATLQIGVEVPVDLFFAARSLFVAAPLMGFGFEYHIDDHFGLGLNTRFGPVLLVSDGGAATFGFSTQLGVLYRI
jgi:hypothetical protein